MAAPSYTEDLTDIDLAEGTGDYSQINFAGGGGGSLGSGPDFSMQGTNAVERQVTNNERGIVFQTPDGVNVSGASQTPNHIYQWIWVATPGLTDLLTDRGVYCIAGAGGGFPNTSDTIQFHMDGFDTYGAIGRVGRCYVYEYNNTAQAFHPYRTVNGSPPARDAGTLAFGVGLNTVATVKGVNLGCDAIRYGTGGFITSGSQSDPATLTGFAAINDAVANRWGILIGIAGGYELQGGLTIGVDEDGQEASDLTFFQDSNTAITIVDLFHCASGFSHITIDGVDTIANFTNITIQGAVSAASSGILINPGQFKVLHEGASVGLSGCTFSNIGQSVLHLDTTAINTTWRATGDVIQRSGTLTGCTFQRESGIQNWGSGQLHANDLDRIIDCSFTNDTVAVASGHAIVIDADSAGTGTYIFNGNSFAGYGADDTGQAAIGYFGTTPIAISVVNAVTPTVWPTSLVSVSNDVTLTVQVNDEAGDPVANARVRISDPTDNSEIAAGTTDGTGEFTTTFNFSSDLDIELRVRLYSTPVGTTYLPFVGAGTITGNGLSSTVRLIEDNIAND